MRLLAIFFIFVLSISCGKKSNSQSPTGSISLNKETPVQVVLGVPSQTLATTTENTETSINLDVTPEGIVVVTANEDELPVVIDTLESVSDIEVVDVGVVETVVPEQTNSESVVITDDITEDNVTEDDLVKYPQSEKILRLFISKIQHRIEIIEKNLSKWMKNNTKNKVAIEKAREELAVLRSIIEKYHQ